ncbi:PLP-dependent transferase [Suillus subalutaceus]|uniref:PLP-dependent transferase n=1 Tax=Suillus subalutaceus TaxID=48586 RepID=UPI001B86D7DD|nr:PLP-dependent transferase [Suillus subalutaceus]KAG1861579.1 PLP-dependent transferase [Suillus subalutaceus]
MSSIRLVLQDPVIVRDFLRTRTPFETAKTALFFYFVITQSLKLCRHVQARGITDSLRDSWTWSYRQVLLLALKIPSVQKDVQQQLDQARLDIEGKLVPQGVDVSRHLVLPDEGKSMGWILAEMEKMDGELGPHADWKHGKLSGAVYHGGEDLSRVIVAAFERYTVSNPLHPDVFPAVRKMEAEIVSMCLRMYNNPDGAGTMTSGGTESIVMAIKTYRDWAREVKGITEPEMIVPATAHAAFDKGGAYMKVKVHLIPVDPVTRKVNIKRVRRAINRNTILVSIFSIIAVVLNAVVQLVGSAVNFPDGNQDDIVVLGELAAKHNIGLHVDCCLGSFIVPFLEKAGLSDGEDGGASISCDTHKYGLHPRSGFVHGSSVIMYRDAALRRHQYYVTPYWTVPLFLRLTFHALRPGALIAGTWAAMQYMGSDGYLKSCREIVSCARTIANTITNSIPELYVLGSPPASVVAFGSKSPEVNVHEVGDAMSKRGWHLNALSGPAAVHIACTRLTLPLVDTFIADLRDSVQQAKLTPSGKGTMVRLYGLGNSSAVGPEMVSELATMFLDTLYKA